MIKKIIGLALVSIVTTSNAQNFSDFANMAQQLQGVAEKIQQSQVSEPSQTATKSTQPISPQSGAAGLTCFVSDDKNAVWATGGRLITSCSPSVIQSQITDPNGNYAIWQFLNEREIKRTFIFSSQMRIPTDSTINTYERKGKRVIENSRGCKLIWDITNETPDSISIKEIGYSGVCDQAVKQAQDNLSKMPATTFRKVKS